MKNIYFKSEIATTRILTFVLIACLGFTFAASAQVRVPFTQRTSQYTPTKKIYNVKGDFAMMGNTNLTLQNYGNQTENGYSYMVYVDVDAADATGLGGTRTFNSSSATLSLSNENGAVPSCSNIVYAGLYWTGRAANISPSNNTFNVTRGGVTKTFDKRKIQFKGPGAQGYSEFTANANDIYYPTTQDDYMYSAYAEVTEYVKAHGIGEYTAADIALNEGSGGGTGFYGGWGLIVVYENSKMKYRDVTIFDGHAYVIGGMASNDLPISGFNTVQNGPVGIKLGVIAGEGDNGLSGDYFQIRRQDNNQWQSLNHSANSETNFFNSSIQTPGARNPDLLNNTGLDISMFNLPNANNALLTNNQTSTTFRYGSTQDTYIIFAIAMAVDAYIPEIEGNLTAVSINNTPVPATGPYTALPGQELEFRVQVRNRGTEPINNATLNIPIPYNTEYVNNSAVREVFFEPAPTPNSLVFNPASGSNGSIIWNIGTLPVPATPDTVLGELVFRVSVTTDCELLKNADCQNVVSVNGSFSGSGAITGITFTGMNLIQGYTQDGNCEGTAIAAPLLVNINASDYVNANCQNTPPVTAFTFCSTGTAIPITAISGSFPSGSTFYNQYPIGPDTVQYTISNPFPATVGTLTYYAVPPGAVQGCFFQFTITVTSINTTPTVTSPVNYCLNAPAQPLTATPSDPGLTLYYFTSIDGEPQVSVTPSTATVGTFTYYVAEASTSTCIGPKVPIVVNVTQSAQITAPESYSLIGCGSDAISEYPYSPNPTVITLAQFQQMGGTVSNVGDAGTPEISYSDTQSGTCPISVIRTFLLNSSCGNVSATQTITILDNIAPVISGLPDADSTISCDETPSWITPSATDNCASAVTLTFEDTTVAGTCTGTFSITRTWTATDACGNTATASQTINVQDNTAPVISVPAQNFTVQCGTNQDDLTEWLNSNGGASATDSCSTVSWSNNYNGIGNDCSSAITVIFTATDSCGNTATTSATVTLTDTTAPVVPEAPAAVTVSCANDVPANTTLTATDNCQGVITAEGVDVVTPGSCPGAFSIVRTWTFTDACGNASSVSQTISVNDTIAPVFAALPATTTVECPATPTFAQATATDNCGGEVTLTFEDSNTPENCAGSFTATRTWTATDACGNSATTSQIINIQDTTAPTITTAAQDLAIQCGTGTADALAQWLASNGGAAATDACSDIIWTNNYDATSNDCSAGITVVFTATDSCGNSATTSATLTISDTVAPVAPEAPADVTIACASEIPANVTLTATDNCSGQISVQGVDAILAGACAGTYTITRTWTFTDSCANATTISQTINVADTIAPVAPTAPADVTIECGDALPANVTLTATDNCGTSITAQGVDVTTAGSCSGASTIVRTWTFADACGNSATVSQTINVLDTTAPVVPAAPADVTATCGSEIPANIPLTALDSCQGEITSQGVDVTTPGACAGTFTIVRTWTFTDTCGNTSSVSQNIAVGDTSGPVLPDAIPADITVSCASDVPAAITLTATDNCDSAPITAEPVDTIVAGNCADSFVLTRTWTFADACGNASVATQVITVNDTIAPTFDQAAPESVSVACGQIPDPALLTATDNCGQNTVAVTMTESTVPGNCSGTFTLVRTWSATDACGNSATVTQNIAVTDTVAPTFVEATPQAAITATCGSVPAAAILTAIDACNNTTIAVVFSETTVAGVCPVTEIITRTWSATDGCGNTTTFIQTVTVQDTTPPTLNEILEPVVNVTCDQVPPVPVLTFTDACSAVGQPTFTETISDVSNGNYTITWTWLVADSCGNEATFTQTVNVTITDSLVIVDNQQCNADVSASIDLMTLLPAGTPAGGTWVNVDNVPGLNGTVFEPNGIPNGFYNVDYVINDAICPRTVRIRLNVNEEFCEVDPACTVTVNNAFSPNNDGINEYFNINGFENTGCVLSNTVEIYNRWGVLVFEMKNYNNNDRAFRGVSEGRATLKQDDELPSGTYFYIITYKKADGTSGKQDGYLYLSR